jgi:hypothetical protein
LGEEMCVFPHPTSEIIHAIQSDKTRIRNEYS